MSFTKENVMGVAAHRGDSYNYPENTMIAFEKAPEAGASLFAPSLPSLSSIHIL